MRTNYTQLPDKDKKQKNLFKEINPLITSGKKEPVVEKFKQFLSQKPHSSLLQSLLNQAIQANQEAIVIGFAEEATIFKWLLKQESTYLDSLIQTILEIQNYSVTILGFLIGFTESNQHQQLITKFDNNSQEFTAKQKKDFFIARQYIKLQRIKLKRNINESTIAKAAHFYQTWVAIQKPIVPRTIHDVIQTLEHEDITLTHETFTKVMNVCADNSIYLIDFLHAAVSHNRVQFAAALFNRYYHAIIKSSELRRVELFYLALAHEEPYCIAITFALVNRRKYPEISKSADEWCHQRAEKKQKDIFIGYYQEICQHHGIDPKSSVLNTLTGLFTGALSIFSTPSSSVRPPDTKAQSVPADTKDAIKGDNKKTPLLSDYQIQQPTMGTD